MGSSNGVSSGYSGIDLEQVWLFCFVITTIFLVLILAYTIYLKLKLNKYEIEKAKDRIENKPLN